MPTIQFSVLPHVDVGEIPVLVPLHGAAKSADKVTLHSSDIHRRYDLSVASDAAQSLAQLLADPLNAEQIKRYAYPYPCDSPRNSRKVPWEFVRMPTLTLDPDPTTLSPGQVGPGSPRKRSPRKS